MEKHKRSEVEAADDFDGKRVPLSGAGLDKLDVVTGGIYKGYRIENKYTEKGSYGVNFKYFKECERLARLENSKVFMRIDDGKHQPLITIRQDLFKELLEDSNEMRLMEEYLEDYDEMASYKEWKRR